MNNIQKQLEQCIEDIAGEKPEVFSECIKDFFDSEDDFISLMMYCEAQFDVEISKEEAEELTDFYSLKRLLEEKINENDQDALAFQENLKKNYDID